MKKQSYIPPISAIVDIMAMKSIAGSFPSVTNENISEGEDIEI